jgi:hypothetical protein
MAAIINAYKKEPCCSPVLKGFIVDLFGIYDGFYMI